MRSLAIQSDFNFVPLFGLGLGYMVVEGQPILSAPPIAGEKGAETKNPPAPVVTGFGPPRVELYGTVSQAYRPNYVRRTGPDRRKQRGKWQPQRRQLASI